MQNAIETQGLGKYYGWRKKMAVKNLNLAVPKGSVYAFLGRNGAGKTTTIRVLMGLLEPSNGKVEVLGMDPDKKPVDIKKRVGYVAENQKMYDWMTIEELMWFNSSFYDTWDSQTAERMLEKFKLDKKQKMKSLSRGMYGKVALLLAIAQKPELLILDDPVMGLDTAVRREFMEGVIEVLHEEKCTVFFSTHIIPEIEKVADMVGIMKDGELVHSGPLEELIGSVKQIRLVFDGEVPKDIECENLIKKNQTAHEVILTVKNYSEEMLKSFGKYNPKSCETINLDLEEIFVEMTE